MATFLDVGILENFSIIFSMILVLGVVYGVLEVTKVLGDSKGLNALIGVICAFFVLMAPRVHELIEFIAPWFVFVFVLFIFLVMGMKMFGDPSAGLAFADLTTVNWILFIIGIIIIVLGFGKVFGQETLEKTVIQDGEEISVSEIEGSAASGEYESNFYTTLFHPKIIGFGLIMLIAFFAMAIIGKEA
ncbi:hypothetical protein ACFL0W_02950 [Nanoarchaeota archaeon]